MLSFNLFNTHEKYEQNKFIEKYNALLKAYKDDNLFDEQIKRYVNLDENGV